METPRLLRRAPPPPSSEAPGPPPPSPSTSTSTLTSEEDPWSAGPVAVLSWSAAWALRWRDEAEAKWAPGKGAEWRCVGAIGPPGCGKSELLNAVGGAPRAHAVRPDARKARAGAFPPPQGRDAALAATPERVAVLLDTPAIASAPAYAAAVAAGGGAPANLGRSELCLVLWALQACHVLLVVQDGLEDRRAWRALAAALAVRKKTDTRPCAEVVFVANRVPPGRCSPLRVESARRELAAAFPEPPAAPGPDVPPHFFALPERLPGDAAGVDPGDAHRSYAALLDELVAAALAMPRRPLRLPSEREWLAGARRAWEELEASEPVSRFVALAYPELAADDA